MQGKSRELYVFQESALTREWPKGYTVHKTHHRVPQSHTHIQCYCWLKTAFELKLFVLEKLPKTEGIPYKIWLETIRKAHAMSDNLTEGGYHRWQGLQIGYNMREKSGDNSTNIAQPPAEVRCSRIFWCSRRRLLFKGLLLQRFLPILIKPA